jgi:hypothetical protein
MLLLAATGLLIALACLPERLATRLPGTVAETVDLPAVAVAAYDHLAATPRALEQTASPRLGLRIVADAA